MSNERIELPSLEARRKEIDTLETFKILNNTYKINKDNFFTYSFANLRGHKQKLFKKRTNTTTAQSFFKHKIVNSWNEIPDSVEDNRGIQQKIEITVWRH